MSVIGPSCNLPSETAPGCGRRAKAEPGGSKAAGTAAVATAVIAAACTACCVLPFTLPAVVLASAGSMIAVLDHAHGLMTALSVAVVLCAWAWIVWRARTSGLKIRSSVLAAMCAATVLTATAALWPVMEHAVFHALGVAKKPKPPAS
ncbi:hypothetical protein JJB99_18785 [Bradyrhizobium diazoefficiens]|uniref:hypothetical protein n=1 Tax=Bradyrhizobium diazoefficiens TaxID=1355477 RepID=UPI00190A7F45|nr:hypothetical protein [Bradyrhizobium diazoefficiens]QQO11568.1 hypothetical protein JJB99_18785 [Bradyrhizobium diazoefficiens]